MIRRIAGLAAVVALVAAAPAQAWRWGQMRAWGPQSAPRQGVLLVGTDGQPVGGHWQRWADQAKVPTMPGQLVFSTDPYACGGPWAAGCSLDSSPAWTMATSRYALYYELGHDFDWHVLTSGERSRLARMWGVPHARWDDSARHLAQYLEDGLEVDFAAAYAACAEGQQITGLSSGLAPAITLGRTCSLIDSAMSTNALPPRASDSARSPSPRTR